jgi:pilus assembly protein Flp/PilA
MLKRFLRDEAGATAIEYGMIVTLISLAIMAAVFGVGTSMSDLLNGFSSSIK